MSDVLLDVITPTEAFWRMLGGNWQTVVLIAVCSCKKGRRARRDRRRGLGERSRGGR